MGCPPEAEPAAGGEWRRSRSGVQGRKDRAGEDAVEDGELMALLVWGGRGRRCELHGGPRSRRR
jgi:hypothetical protein